ncbi:MAG: hypothetical protein HYS13_03840 [Planctomycetia bacterium]|nr:hypothetical protein [Planctomycetia bacterium]
MRGAFALCLILSLAVNAGCGRESPARGPAVTAASFQDPPREAQPPPDAAPGDKNENAPEIGAPAAGGSLALFEKRILPIFQAARPSSCSECHLSGVDLKDYIKPSQEETFASLVAAGLVNVDKPDDSKILQFIRRRPEKPSLVTDKVRQEELEAFRAWIAAAVKDEKLLTAKAASEPIGPALPAEVIRHARQDRVLSSFIDNVWSEVGRCAACHSPDRNQKQVKEHGEQVSWITLRDPAATMQYMLEAGLIDPEEPENSLILLKPTMQVKHGGGQKMLVGDRTYKQFRRFLDDYAAVAKGMYQKAEDLPRPSDEVSKVSEIWLKLTEVPAGYDKLLLQVDLYRREGDGWSKTRWATSDRAVFGQGKLWQHSLTITAERGTQRADEIRRTPALPRGRYLVRIYVDKTGKLARDFKAELSAEDLVGEVEVDTAWPAGYGSMTAARFPAR